MLQRLKSTVYELLCGEGNGKGSQITELIIDVAICLNVALIVFESVDMAKNYSGLVSALRTLFFLFFFVEYFMRLWIADITIEKSGALKARLKYAISFNAVVNLLALMPVMFGKTIIDFRIFRVIRLLRITQIKSLKRYTNILEKVLKLKGPQLLSSFFILLVFTLASAVIIFDLENPAQPEVFNNILSSLWWSMSTVTTVGYGDMYPVTPIGKILASWISIFGVFLVAVPVGILTSGFFEVSKNIESIHDKKRRK